MIGVFNQGPTAYCISKDRRERRQRVASRLRRIDRLLGRAIQPPASPEAAGTRRQAIAWHPTS